MNHTPQRKLNPILFNWASGVRELPLLRVRSIMERYISPIMVASVFERALETPGIDGRQRTVEEVVEHCMVGLRLFVPADQLSKLMVELAEVLVD